MTSSLLARPARTNRYAGPCSTCQQTVPAEQGVLDRVDGAWKVRHPHGQCPAPLQARTVCATTPGVYRHNGDIYVVKPSRTNKGRVYACQLVESAHRLTEAGTVIPFELVFRPGAIYDLTEADRMPLAEAEQIATRYGRCFICGTPLTAAKSVRKAIGPVCEKRYFPTGKTTAPTAGQTTTDESAVDPASAVSVEDDHRWDAAIQQREAREDAAVYAAKT